MQFDFHVCIRKENDRKKTFKALFICAYDKLKIYNNKKEGEKTKEPKRKIKDQNKKTINTINNLRKKQKSVAFRNGSTYRL